MNSYKILLESNNLTINKFITRPEVDIILKFINNLSKNEDTTSGKMILKFKENGSGSKMTVNLSESQLESLKALLDTF